MATAKKIPLRKCTGCNEMKPKKDLVRVIKTPEDEILVDLTGKKSGRGAYICKNEECLDKIIKSKRLEKVFEKEISQELYESIRGVISGK